MTIKSSFIIALFFMPCFISAMELTADRPLSPRTLSKEAEAIGYITTLRHDNLKRVLASHPTLNAPKLLQTLDTMPLQPFYNQYHNDRFVHNCGRLFFIAFFGYCGLASPSDAHTLICATVLWFAISRSYIPQTVYNERIDLKKTTIRDLLTYYQDAQVKDLREHE